MTNHISFGDSILHSSVYKVRSNIRCFPINCIPEGPKTRVIDLAMFRGTKHCNSELHSRAQVGFKMIDGVFWDIDPPQNFASQQCSWSSSESKLESTECLLGYQAAELRKTLTALVSRYFQVLSEVVLVFSQLFFPWNILFEFFKSKHGAHHNR
jgi:hypothetical protein